MNKTNNLPSIGFGHLDGRTLCKKDLRSLLDASLANGFSFRIKAQTGSGLRYSIDFLSPASIDSVQFNLSENTGNKGLSSRIGSKTIAIVGPDGSGKTTLMDGIKSGALGEKYRFKRFKRYFRRILPYVFRHEDRNDREQKLLWLILPVSFCTFTLGFLLSAGSRLTILDRYFYDYMIRNVRETANPLSKVANYACWTRVLPKPVKLVITICPPAEIHKRKREMSLAAINDLYDVYLDQVVDGGLTDVLFCNTSLDVETSCQQLSSFLQT